MSKNNKYAVNYSRKFPDHRVFNDLEQYERIKWNPLANLKLKKLNFIDGWVKNTPVMLTVAGLFFLMGVGYYVVSDTDGVTSYLNTRPGYTGAKWGLQSERRNELGRFDIIRNTWENDKRGNIDWPFQYK